MWNKFLTIPCLIFEDNFPKALFENCTLKETPQEGRKGTKDRLKSLMDNVIKVVENELKSILKKDINKKLCESYAYLLFDKWWSEQVWKLLIISHNTSFLRGKSASIRINCFGYWAKKETNHNKVEWTTKVWVLALIVKVLSKN